MNNLLKSMTPAVVHEHGNGWPEATQDAGALMRRLMRPLLNRRRVLRLLGWPGVVGVGLLVMCQTFYLSAIRPARATLEMTHQSAISLQERLRHAATGFSQSELTPAEQLAQFYRIFPEDKSLLPWLEKVFAVAQRQGLRLDQGEYKLTRDRVGRLMRFQMTLPVKAEYPQIRRFLNELRVEIPILAMEQLQFERQKVNDPVVDAKIVFDLYLGHES